MKSAMWVMAVFGAMVYAEGYDTYVDVQDPTSMKWPLPPVNSGSLLEHGWHCTAELMQNKNTTMEIEIMHSLHCKSLLRKVLNFLHSSPGFNPMKLICDDMIKTKRQAKPHSVPATTPSYYQNANRPGKRLAEPPPTPSYYQNANRPGKRLAEPPPTPSYYQNANRPGKRQPPPPPPYYQNGKRSLKETVADQIMEENSAISLQQRQSLFDALGRYNFQDILMKEYRRQKLTNAETEYLQLWRNDEAVHLAAYYIKCNLSQLKRGEILRFLENLVK